MAARLTVKAINGELGNAGTTRGLKKANGYFYFKGGEATEWINRTVGDTFGP